MTQKSATALLAPLRQRVLRAGAWSLLGYAASLFLRVAGNLVLTRILFPEAFGLMALVQAVLVGLAMMSDVGIGQSIVQNHKGSSAAFVNTAWTLKIIRGGGICIVTGALAGPFAALYGEPMLAYLLPAAGLTALIGAFASTNFALAERDLHIARATLVEVGSAALGLAATILLAWTYQSIWALVIGSLAGSAVKSAASHIWLAGERNRLVWDPASLRALSTFGRWILVSSALTFLVGEGNRLLIGALLDVRSLAFLSLAMAVVQIPRQFFQTIGGRILFPAYSEVERERPERLFAVLERALLLQIVPYWAACVLLVYFGEGLIHVMYDERYHDAGWMLQILAMGSLAGCITGSYGGILWAKGMVRLNSVLLAVQLILQCAAIAIGALVGGAGGLVSALGCVSWVLYPVYAVTYARLSLWQPRIDLPVLGLSIVVVLSVTMHRLHPFLPNP